MTVAIATSANASGVSWLRLSGTIQEVLDQSEKERLTATNCVYWSDDGTDAKAVFCRLR